MLRVIMNKEGVIKLARKFVCEFPGNYITEEIAVSPKCVGIKIYEVLIFAFTCGLVTFGLPKGIINKKV